MSMSGVDRRGATLSQANTRKGGCIIVGALTAGSDRPHLQHHNQRKISSCSEMFVTNANDLRVCLIMQVWA